MARLPAAGKSIAIVVAVLLAALATWAIFSYVQGIEQRAFDDAELVEVFLAEQEIPAGQSAQQASQLGSIVRDNLPRTAIPDGAIGQLEQINDLVALERILPGEIIVQPRWGQPEDVATSTFEIPEGHEAISVQVGLVPGVAGYVGAGDRVSMIAHLELPQEEDEDAVDEDGEPIPPSINDFLAQYLLQDVEVLAVGPRPASQPAEGDGEPAAEEEAGGSVLLTVALEPEDAEKLVFAINNANLHFTLLPEDAEPADTPGRTLDDLFDD